MKRWIDSANNAIEGVLHAARTERHVQYHLFTAIAVLLLSYALGISRDDFLVVAVIVIMVLLAEMLNTAIEHLVDLVSPQYHEHARCAKDIAAGAVLVTAFGALILGYIILYPYLADTFKNGMKIARHTSAEIALLAFVTVIIMVIIVKAWTGKGHPLRGGMPSGHTAVAFSLWVAIVLMTEQFTVALGTFLLSCMVARSRVSNGVHTVTEVVIGALLGAGVTFVLFKIFL